MCNDYRRIEVIKGDVRRRRWTVERHVAFVKTLKRDYIRISQVLDAETALRLIEGWIEDYNEIHPHSALKMASPRQFIRAKSN